MRILIDIGHPAHAHLFKNMIWNLKKKGHEVKITVRDKDVVLSLLMAYGFRYENIGKHKGNIISKALDVVKRDYSLYKVAKKFNPDIIVGATANLFVAHVSKLINKPSIIFDDTEHERLQRLLYKPFVNTICTPSCFKKDLGDKQVRYNGYHELAYLHPNYFVPNPVVMENIGLDKDERFILIRFVLWDPSHYIGEHGFDSETKLGLVKRLEDYGKVFITSETKLAKEFDKYKIGISPEKIHDLLYYATLYVGEGATMATEAGILGTPSIYVSSLVGTMANFEELEKRYMLVYSFRNQDIALEKAVNFLEDKDIKKKWQKKREKLLDEKIDVTKFMTEFIENYPRSFEVLKNKR